MKYALVNGKKVEATKGAKGICRVCGNKVSAYCGDEYIHHWKHDKKCKCNSWHEKETKWHRMWKDYFPEDWQEVVQFDDTGEKHIADVKTGSGWVLEIQHSHIKSEERLSRNTFYPKLVWVLDGTRRKRDKPNFHRILDEYEIRSDDPRFMAVIGPHDCKLIKEWHESNALVFMDFQDADDSMQPILWFLFPRIANNEAYLWPISRDKFIELHNNNKFDELVEKTISPYIKKLIYKENLKVEMEESRRREAKARMDSIIYGKRSCRF